MAGDWIKMRADLHTHPKVYKLAEILKIDELTAVGALFCFWSWADKHAVDGRVDGATSRLVDRTVRVDGLTDALVSIGWLEVDEAGITLPRFSEHNGDSAKERSLKNQRQARWRDRKAAGLVDEKASTQASTKASTREEKRREEEKTPLTPLSGGRQKSAIAFQTFVDRCKADGEKAISDYAPVLRYVEKSKLPMDFVGLCWDEFKRRHSPNGGSDAKRYTDWRKAFLNCLQSNWYGLWYAKAEGEYELTTKGLQAKTVHKEAA